MTIKLPCFGFRDWRKQYGIVLTAQQKEAIGKFPWSEADLNAPCPFHPGKMIRETHFAFVIAYSINMMEFQRINPKELPATSEPWYSQKKFATEETLKLRWHLLLKDIVPDSENKTFKEQAAMLPEGYKVPSAVAEAAKDIFLYKKAGVYANPNRYARTSDIGSDSYHVFVGNYDGAAVKIDYNFDDFSYPDIGIGAARKFTAKKH